MSKSETDKAAKLPKYLLLTQVREHGYFHLYGRVVTQKYEDGQYVPYGVDDDYSDGLLWTGLRVSCQGSDDSAQRDAPVCGFDVTYPEPYNVGLRKSKRMTKTLDKLDRGLAKLGETRGYVREYGDYCGRVAETLGCIGMGFERSRDAFDRSGYRYDWETIGSGINRVDNLIFLWVESFKEKTEAVA